MEIDTTLLHCDVVDVAGEGVTRGVLAAHVQCSNARLRLQDELAQRAGAVTTARMSFTNPVTSRRSSTSPGVWL